MALLTAILKQRQYPKYRRYQFDKIGEGSYEGADRFSVVHTYRSLFNRSSGSEPSDMIDRTLKEEVVRARLSKLGFDLERDPGGLDWIVRDRREGKEGMKAVPTGH
jgi:hypothetical protein